MRAIVAIVICLVLSCAACSSPDRSKLTITTSGELGLSIDLVPDPPTAGIETMTIGVHDLTNKPVEDATVEVNTTMGAMNMNGKSVMARPQGNGLYSAVVEVGATARWLFTVTAKVGDRKGMARVAVDVR